MSDEARHERYRQLNADLAAIFNVVVPGKGEEVYDAANRVETIAKDGLAAIQLLAWVWSFIPGSWVKGHPSYLVVKKLLERYDDLVETGPTTTNGNLG